MYDLSTDPNEMKNLFEAAGYVEMRKELEEMNRALPGPERETFDEPIGMS